MRPMTLSIQGLHSFMDEQTIDFKRLTEKGLFGIFGPTGSGKSTILDGITLALYGKISRESKTFINANGNTCAIQYEFVLGSQHYRVARRFKRDSKSGNSRNESAILIVLHNDQETVLASDVKTVNDSCETLIGLSLADFTRTVVLPQGKFSDFLKLEGKDRRDMLERLFHLEQYGNALSNRLTQETSGVKLQLSHIEGQLMHYEEVNAKQVTERAKELQRIKQELSHKKTEEQKLRAQHQQWLTIIQWQDELLRYKKQSERLDQEEATITNLRNQCIRAVSAGRVLPYLVEAKQAKFIYHQTLEKQNQSQQDIKQLDEQKETLEAAAKEIIQQKDDRLPLLLLQAHVVKETMDQVTIRDALQTDIVQTQEAYKQTLHHLQIARQSAKEVDDKRQIMNDDIILLEAEKRRYVVDHKMRGFVQNGLRLEERMIGLAQSIKQNQAKCSQIIETKTKDQEAYEQNKIQATRLFQIHQTATDEWNQLVKQTPTTDALYALRDQLRLVLENETILQNMQTQQTALVEETTQLANEMKTNTGRKEELQRHYSELAIQVQNSQRNHMVNVLRKEWKEDETCPVCGSAHHPEQWEKATSHVQTIEEVERWQETMNRITREIQRLGNEWTAAQTKQTMGHVQLAMLGDDIKQIQMALDNQDSKTLSAIYQAQYDAHLVAAKRMEELQEVLAKNATARGEVEKTLSSLASMIQSHEIQIAERSQQGTIFQLEWESLEASSRAMQVESGIIDYTKKQEEIHLFDGKHKQCEETLQLLRQQWEEATQESIIWAGEIMERQQQAIQQERDLIHKQTRCEEIQTTIAQNIPNQTDQPDLHAYQTKLNNEIQSIQEAYESISRQQSQFASAYREAHELVLTFTTTLKEHGKRLEETQQRLQEAMAAEGMTSQTQIEADVMDGPELEAARVIVAKHETTRMELATLIVSVQAKLSEDWLTIEEMVLLQQRIESLAQSIEEMADNISKLDGELARMTQNLTHKEVLLNEQTIINHRYGMLVDLEKLFRGKRFVEFAAMNQLEYVSMEANQRLREMTNGTYGLEIDETGMFIIRDYKNGGVAREVSTLSGGETFLASLSLALALSAQIQLKGNSPLELFFLDEGFGTLDEAHLEVVMSSLERIHHDKLKIGLISHVESIKHRIPIKLMVEPAIGGEGGSKVHIELS